MTAPPFAGRFLVFWLVLILVGGVDKQYRLFRQDAVALPPLHRPPAK